jgi:hypothetical protein
MLKKNSKKTFLRFRHMLVSQPFFGIVTQSFFEFLSAIFEISSLRYSDSVIFATILNHFSILLPIFEIFAAMSRSFLLH